MDWFRLYVVSASTSQYMQSASVAMVSYDVRSGSVFVRDWTHTSTGSTSGTDNDFRVCRLLHGQGWRPDHQIKVFGLGLD